MFATEAGVVFQGFGPSAFFARPRPLVSHPLPRDGAGRRRLIRTQAPAAPGVYGMIDADGQLIYVGKSKRLANRLMSYFPSRRTGEKSEHIGRRAKRLVWETAGHEFLALLRELELIRRFEPRFNVEGRPERQRPAFICLTPGPAPFFRVVNQPPAGCEIWFGPLAGVGRYRAAVEQLNRRFLLRDCPQKTPMLFADQRELFAGDRKAACLRYELGTCLGPCAALCSSRDYADSIDRALAFLRGEDLSVLNGLERDMRNAARNQQFERAAALRDPWESLATIHRGMERLRQLRRNFSFVYELRCRNGQIMWILIRAGHAVSAYCLPRGARSARESLQRLAEVYSSNAVEGAGEDLDMLRLVGGWFQKYESAIKATRTPEEAAEFCMRLVEAKPTRSAGIQGMPYQKAG